MFEEDSSFCIRYVILRLKANGDGAPWPAIDSDEQLLRALALHPGRLVERAGPDRPRDPAPSAAERDRRDVGLRQVRTIYEHENGDVTLLDNANDGYDLSGETGCHGRGTDLLYHGPDADMRPFDSALDPNDFLDCKVIGTVRSGERPDEKVLEIHPDRAGARGRLVLGIAPGDPLS